MMLIGVDLRSSAAINVFFTAPQGALPHGRGSDWGTRALYWSHPHARYALAPAGGNSRDPRRRGLPISGTKETVGRPYAGCSRAAFGRPERLLAALAVSRQGPENRPHQIRHRRRKHAAGERRFPGGSQERHHEDLR